jgi:hypothetical protein
VAFCVFSGLDVHLGPAVFLEEEDTAASR